MTDHEWVQAMEDGILFFFSPSHFFYGERAVKRIRNAGMRGKNASGKKKIDSKRFWIGFWDGIDTWKEWMLKKKRRRRCTWMRCRVEGGKDGQWGCRTQTAPHHGAPQGWGCVAGICIDQSAGQRQQTVGFRQVCKQRETCWLQLELRWSY